MSLKLVLAVVLVPLTLRSAFADPPQTILNLDELRYRSNALCCTKPWKSCCFNVYRNPQGQVLDLDGGIFNPNTLTARERHLLGSLPRE